MLVLSRKANEEINIGNHITVVVIAVNGNRVKLGFSAPSNVSILRDELRSLHPAEFPTDTATCDRASDAVKSEFAEPFSPDPSY